MPESPRLVTVGTISGGATPIEAEVTSVGSDVPVSVVLSADYSMLDPDEYPSRPSFTGAAQGSLQHPRTIPSGTTIRGLRCEAVALVAAGAATYA
jgi:hypothetical protein